MCERVRQREAGACDEMVARFGRGVSTILRRVTGDAALSEDLFQDTFVILIEKVREGAVREPDKLAAFVASLARNVALGHFRREPRHRRQDLEDAGPIVAPDPGPLEQLSTQEKCEMARTVLREMASERDREILNRFYMSGDAKEEICADFGLGIPDFNRVIHRARERYRALFEKKFGKEAE